MDSIPDLPATGKEIRLASRPDGEPTPADFELAWPLWVGKRWSCHYVSRAPGREDLPLFVGAAVGSDNPRDEGLRGRGLRRPTENVRSQ